MSWTDEVPNDIGSVVILLKKHNCYWEVVVELLFCIFCILMFVVSDWDVIHLVVALGSFGIAARTIGTTFAKERVEKLEGTVADLADELIVKEHEVERLQQELEACKAVQRKPAEKKPFSKRKPKPKTEDKNENHLD